MGGGWEDPKEVEVLIMKIKWWFTVKDLELPEVIHVMLNRRILPLQHRATPMWEHKSGDAGPVLHIFHTTLAIMWTRLFKLAKDKIPKEGEDCSLKDGYEAPR